MRPSEESPITREQAVAIAEADARLMYGDLSGFVLKVSFMNERWCVEYRFQGRRFVTGGGPRYVINGFDGTIISKAYGQ